jgi:hypothetical protein
MEPWLRVSITLLLTLSFIVPTVRTLSFPIAVPDPTYTTGTAQLITASYSSTTNTSFPVTFATTMSTPSLNASLGIMGINYDIRSSRWGWRITIASVLQSSLSVLISVSDSSNPIYSLRICYFVTYNTLIDVQEITNTFSIMCPT